MQPNIREIDTFRHVSRKARHWFSERKGFRQDSGVAGFWTLFGRFLDTFRHVLDTFRALFGLKGLIPLLHRRRLGGVHRLGVSIVVVVGTCPRHMYRNRQKPGRFLIRILGLSGLNGHFWTLSGAPVLDTFGAPFWTLFGRFLDAFGRFWTLFGHFSA